MRRLLKSRSAKVVSWFVVFSFVFTFLPAKESLADALTKSIQRWQQERKGRSRPLTLAEMRVLKGGQGPIQPSDEAGAGVPESWEGSDPASPFSKVNVGSGNLFTSIPVAGFAGRGLDIGLTLHHNSSDLNTSAPLSAGWTHSYNITLTESQPGGGDVTVREGTGRRHTFLRNADGSYTHPAGVFETLVQNADGTYTLTRHSQVQLNFDSANRLSTMVDPNGNTVTLSYNAQGQLTSVTEASGKALSFAYNGEGKLSAVTDPLNRTVSFTYDGLTGYLYTVTYPDNTTLTFTYDVQGRIWSITDPRGNVWEYDYDMDGRIVEAHHPGTGQNALRTYTWLGNGVDVTDQTNKVVGYRKNANGELSQVIIDPSGLALTSSASYDSQHNATSATNPRGYTTTTTYDNSGNALSVTDPLNRTVTMTYDNRNNPLTVTDNAGHVTQYAYDAHDNLTQVTDALNNQTTYTYDAYGNRLTQTLNGHTTTFGYDSTGNLTSLQDALGNTTSFSYNAVGWRTSRTDALNRTTNYSYDVMGQLTTITYPNSSQVTYTYDAAGNRTQMVDSTGTTTWTYNARNLATSESKGGEGITYSYDDASRKTSQTDQANVTTSYSYDAAGRLTSVTADGKTTTYGYDANSNLTTQTNPNGTTVTQTFNNADELTSLVNKKSDASTLSQFSYTYNSDGLRSQVNETLGSQTATVTYTYDALHRLKDEVRTGADAYENHFTYDAAGNRLTWNDGVGTTTYTYDAADRLTQDGNTTYTYNANGSRITKTLNGSTTNYSYDFDEQLTQVASPTTGTSSFSYDGSGRRVSRTNGGMTTTFHFSGSSITTEKQGANVVAHYVYGANRVSRDASGSYEYYHNDGLGSTRQLSNDNQSLTQTTTFDAFGNIESSAGSSSNAYKYAGQWGYRNDGDDGLMHVGARYYDPLVGRFISADSYLGEMGNPQSLNRYVYCEGDPVNGVDPSGRRPVWVNRVAKLIQEAVEFCTPSTTGAWVLTGSLTIVGTITAWPYILNDQPSPGIGGVLGDIGAIAGGIGLITAGVGIAIAASPAIVMIGAGVAIGTGVAVIGRGIGNFIDRITDRLYPIEK